MWVELQNHISHLTSHLAKTEPLVGAEQIPDGIREAFVYTGYRPMNRSWSYYLRSLLYLHNESLNVWTHAVGSLLVLSMAWSLLQNFDLAQDKVSWAIVVFSASCFSTLCMSTVAHLFHSKSVDHHILFFLMDYAGVTIFTFGTGVASMYICSSRSFHDRWSAGYLPVLVLAGLFAFFTCCLARISLAGSLDKRKLLMVSGVFIQGTFTGIPTFTRYWECLNEPSCSMSSLNHITVPLVLTIMTAIAFSAHAPERWLPGCFDFIGHSHQIFHIVSVLLMVSQFRAIYIDSVVLNFSHHVNPEPVSIVLALVCLVVGQGLIIAWVIMRKLHDAPKDAKAD